MKNIALTLSVLFIFFLSCVSDPGRYRASWQKGWYYDKDEGTTIVRTAKRYLGTRYRKGGSSPAGFDCSGYVMYVYKRNGILLPRTAKSQFFAGRKIARGRVRPGDLLFFKTTRKRYSHVGIYVGEHRFIHSPRTGKRVSYADMDKPYWKRRYIGAVTFIHESRLPHH
jgi:cell wall-associated NlpC family hydrolase